MAFRIGVAVVALIVLACLGVASAGYVLVHSPIDAPASTIVRHDDFSFALDGPIVVARPGPQETKTIQVMLRIENDAKRVSYEWQPTTAYLVDEDGGRYETDISSSTAATSIPAGQSARVKVSFAVPYASRDLRLAFWDTVMMGDVFDGVRYARLRLRLTD